MKNSKSDDGDLTLVQLAQAGDRSAFEGLVEKYKKRAYHLAFNFTHDREEAKDLSQEAFLSAFKKLDSFDGRAAFYTWFYRILVNLCLDDRKRRGRISLQSLDQNAQPSRESVFTDAMAKRRLETALWDLSPNQRTAFLLKHHHGLSVRDIAQVTGAAEGTVKAHIHRAVRALRESLSGILKVV